MRGNKRKKVIRFLVNAVAVMAVAVEDTVMEPAVVIPLSNTANPSLP